jgi:hypothetical protein
MDLTDSIAPRSDQTNAEDFLTGPRTVTIAEVKRGTPEQPVDIHLVEFPGRPFKPSKTVRRILVGAWGANASAYAGRRMTLYRDDKVRFGGMDVGGIRVSHLSHIDKPMTLVLAVSKGKRAPYVVQPLVDAVAAPAVDSATSDQLASLGDGLKALGITDRDAMVAAASQVIDREIKSALELTRTEAAAVLDWIKHEQEAPAEIPGTQP